jgi:hypothetical protein
MPNKQNKRTAKPKKGKAPRRTQTTPGFEPKVNHTAGPAANGVRVGFPAERTVTLLYCDYDGFSSSTGVLGKYQYRLNSCFDPDFTGTGHQPMGFDQWAAYYNHYVVEECAYEVEMSPTGTVYTYQATHISDDSTVPTNLSEIQELGGVVAMGTPYSSTNSHIFKGKVNIAKFFNRSSIATDSELRALTTANPTETCYLNLFASNADPVQGQAFYFAVKLAYRVRFMEPKDLAPSLLLRPRNEDDYEYVCVRKGTGLPKLPPTGQPIPAKPTVLLP